MTGADPVKKERVAEAMRSFFRGAGERLRLPALT